MTFDPAKPVRTRGGNKSRVICTDVVTDDFPIVALVQLQDGSERIRTFTRKGLHVRGGSGDATGDLVNVPTIRKYTNAELAELSGTQLRLKIEGPDASRTVLQVLSGEVCVAGVCRCDARELLDKCVHLDGSPCGVAE